MLPRQAASPYRHKHRELLGVSSAVIDLESTTRLIDEGSLKKLFFSDWHSGNFDDAFPELGSVSSDISTLEINDAVHRVESQVASAEKNISLLGFNVPVSQLSQRGILVLLSVQCYLWLHLHELSKRIEPDAEGWDVAWIGVYRTRAAMATTVISCFLMPVCASMTLAWRLAQIPHYYRRTMQAVCIVVIVLSAAIGLLTVWRLIKLRQSLPENVAGESPSSVDAV